MNFVLLTISTYALIGETNRQLLKATILNFIFRMTPLTDFFRFQFPIRYIPRSSQYTSSNQIGNIKNIQTLQSVKGSTVHMLFPRRKWHLPNNQRSTQGFSLDQNFVFIITGIEHNSTFNRNQSWHSNDTLSDRNDFSYIQNLLLLIHLFYHCDYLSINTVVMLEIHSSHWRKGLLVLSDW